MIHGRMHEHDEWPAGNNTLYYHDLILHVYQYKWRGRACGPLKLASSHRSRHGSSRLDRASTSIHGNALVPALLLKIPAVWTS